MTLVHRCVLCDWERDGRSPTILSPHCERCGGLLMATRRSHAGADRAPMALPAPPALPPALHRLLALAAAAVILSTAAVSGAHAGGPWIGLACLGLAAVFTAQLLIRRP